MYSVEMPTAVLDMMESYAVVIHPMIQPMDIIISWVIVVEHADFLIILLIEDPIFVMFYFDSAVKRFIGYKAYVPVIKVESRIP